MSISGLLKDATGGVILGVWQVGFSFGFQGFGDRDFALGVQGCGLEAQGFGFAAKCSSSLGGTG